MSQLPEGCGELHEGLTTLTSSPRSWHALKDPAGKTVHAMLSSAMQKLQCKVLNGKNNSNRCQTNAGQIQNMQCKEPNTNNPHYQNSITITFSKNQVFLW